MTASDPRRLSGKEAAAIEAVFENLPSTYPEIRWKLGAISKAFRTEIARYLEPHWRQWAKSSQNPMSVAEARTRAMWIDSTLTNLGLCITFNGEPALLAEERIPSSHEGRSPKAPAQFILLTRTDKWPYYEKAATCETMPEFDIGPAPDNAAGYLEPLRQRAYAYARGR